MFQAMVFTLGSVLTAQQPISFSVCDLRVVCPFSATAGGMGL